MTPLLGFAPDMEATTPGVITDCEHFIPYLTGMEAAPTPETPTGAPPLAADCRGAAVAVKLDNTRRVFGGTATHMYELSGGVWVDRSRAGNYTGGADTRWSFTQFGDTTLIANRADVIQRSAGAAFADIATAPKAEIIFAVGGQVMALNTNDGAEKPNGWHCSAIFDDTNWTPALATQAARGLLVATPGPISAGAKLGEYAIAYKNRSMYLGQYVGAPAVWDWTQVPGGDAGCVGKEALCDIDGAHFFVGPDNMWIFDGTRPNPVGNDQVRQWFYDSVSPQNISKTKCIFDRQQNRVWVFYPSIGSTVCDSALVFHVKGQKWGRSNREIQAVINYISSGVTFDTWNQYGATYDDLPKVSYESQFWLAGGATLSFFNADNQLQSLTGNATDSSFTTGDAGDDALVTMLSEIRLRFAAGKAPVSATATTYFKEQSGDAYTVGDVVPMENGKFNPRQSAQWHKARFDVVGPTRVTHINPTTKVTGQR
ncbi:MAG: hypothetical protein EOO23_01710 [Comamonadaceae bacterium]|nr:MAG: hypothetical protein EOO23_01710 [Comamonadaceae bacterium]